MYLLPSKIQQEHAILNKKKATMRALIFLNYKLLIST